MRKININLRKHLDLSKDRWSAVVAGLVVALLLLFLFTPHEPESRLRLNSPVSAHALHMDKGDSSNHLTDAGSPSLPRGGQEENNYVCPMMCIPPTKVPGNCPVCGMALKPGANDSRSTESGHSSLHLSPEDVHVADIRTATVRRMPLSAEIRLFGRIDFDSAHITKITAFMPGVIDRVYIKRAGQFVRWGDPLFDIYSSDLLGTQQQLVEAMRYVPSFLAFQANSPHVAQDVPVQAREKSSADGRRTPEQKEALQKIAALRHKLSILGLPKRDIDQFMRKGEATGIATVYAPMYGQIIEQDATEGTFVNTGTDLFTIADPKYVWARLDAYESDYPWIRIGQRVTFTCEAYPGEIFESKIAYVDPVFDETTRTFSIGAITIEDKGGRLKAGMLVRAIAHANLNAKGTPRSSNRPRSVHPLVIPRTAPLITGKRAVVFVADPNQKGSYEGREVLLGPRGKNHYVVRSGLEEGDRVVVNGNFKIDSAMQISARPSLMSPGGSNPMKGHGLHGNHVRPGVSGHGTPSDHAALPHIEENLVGEHRQVELAEGMHEYYMGQRRNSRTITAGAHTQVGGHEPRHDIRYLQNSENVHRRRPGQYGDTTRRRTTEMEEHRNKFRKPKSQ